MFKLCLSQPHPGKGNSPRPSVKYSLFRVSTPLWPLRTAARAPLPQSQQHTHSPPARPGVLCPLYPRKHHRRKAPSAERRPSYRIPASPPHVPRRLLTPATVLASMALKQTTKRTRTKTTVHSHPSQRAILPPSSLPPPAKNPCCHRGMTPGSRHSPLSINNRRILRVRSASRAAFLKMTAMTSCRTGPTKWAAPTTNQIIPASFLTAPIPTRIQTAPMSARMRTKTPHSL
jgi:hypothetical protein